MKVLHLNQSDIEGGAAIAAYRLHEGLNRIGVDSRLLVPGAKLHEETTSLMPPMSIAERAFFKLTFKVLPMHTNILRTWKIFDSPAYREADVVNFHNLHTGLYFNYLTIPRFTQENPVVFTLHDMWSFTGHCSYSYDCERWRSGCGACPYPQTYPAMQWDHSALEHWLKKRVYAKSKLTIVTPSRWLSGLARESILGRFPVHTIPNGLDTDLYSPMDRSEARRQLGLPLDRVVLMFGCADLKDARKGMDLLVEVLKTLPAETKQRVMLYAIGHAAEGLAETTGIATKMAGYVAGDRDKARAYSAADIFISTARADNLPLVLQESMACGTPMAAYDVGGIGDVVRQGVTGFTAPMGDLEGLRQRLMELIENPALRGEMAMACRKIALAEYGLTRTAEKYRELYANL